MRACVWEQHRVVSQSLNAHSAVLLQLLPNLIYFHSQFVSSYPEEKSDVTAAREPPLKQSTSVATKDALTAALRVCRLAVAAVFSFQHYNRAWQGTLTGLQNSKPGGSKTTWRLLLHWGCINFCYSKSFLRLNYFYCITLNFHFPSFANCILSHLPGWTYVTQQPHQTLGDFYRRTRWFWSTLGWINK